MWQDLAVEDAAGVASVGIQMLLHVKKGIVPDGSKRELPLARAQTESDAGCASRRPHL